MNRAVTTRRARPLDGCRHGNEPWPLVYAPHPGRPSWVMEGTDIRYLSREVEENPVTKAVSDLSARSVEVLTDSVSEYSWASMIDPYVTTLATRRALARRGLVEGLTLTDLGLEARALLLAANAKR